MDINFLNNAFKGALPEQILNQRQTSLEFEPDNRPIRRMHLNECAYLPSPKVFEAIKEHASKIHRYPDLNWSEITQALSNYTGMAQNRIVMGNGSDEAIVAAGRITLETGSEMLVSMPSFPSYYKNAIVNGATLLTTGIQENGAIDIDLMLSRITNKTKLVFAATPNNPTGGVLRNEDIERLVEKVPDTALLILDEAYYEFTKYSGVENQLNIMKMRKGPWAVFRTFSKAYGLAGLRVGYILCGSEEVYAGFQLARSTFNVNILAQVAACAALKDERHMQDIVSKTIVERQRIYDGLISLGCKPYPSAANFISAFTPLMANQIKANLAKKRILISQVNAVGFEKCIRVTAGTKADTDAFLSEITKILAQ